MAKVSDLESKMAEVFVDKAPKLPAGGKKFIVDVAPWLALIAGVLSIFAVINLWHWAHVVNNGVDYLNDLCNAYAVNAGACANNVDTRLTVWVWLAMIVVLIQGVLYLRAFPGLWARNKQGWNFVFYASLVSVAYSVVSLFTGYNAVSGFIFGLIFAAIGFWLLFQVRGSYSTTKAAPKHDAKA